jgi:RHS repeat-associated protein
VNDNQIKYNSKELQTEAKLNWYDFGARFYDPVLGRWHVTDLMAESYFSQSPYHFSGNNPILFLDLNGMNYDEFEFNSKGNINNVKESETDSFRKVDEKGNRIEGVELKLDKKVVTGEVTLATNGGTKADYLKVTGDDEATQIFTFLAENTTESSTEVGLTRIGNKSGEDGQNMIGVNTEHVENRTVANSAVFENGYTIRQANHSHPNDNPGSSIGDIATAKRIKDKFHNATFNNYTKTFGFTPYDENTIPGAIYLLPTFEIKAPKNE